MEFPILKNEEIILKQLTHEYINEVFNHFSQDEVNKYTGNDSTKTIDEAKSIIDWGANLFPNNVGILWGIFRKTDNVFMGELNYVKRATDNNLSKAFRAEIGYDLTPEYWGKGYVSAAIKLGNEFVFNEMGINRIEALSHPLNIRSHNTLERNRFTREGILKEFAMYQHGYQDLMMFSLLKKDF
jgi:[ribosomal protein S5]-alanine N-acetyltransferase